MADKTKVLLVDDEVSFVTIMKERIESWGYEVVPAYSGKDGIYAATHNNPQVIILDYKLPDMDGVSVLTAIREAGVQTPVIMFTAHPDERSFKESEKYQVSAFIPKLSVYSDAQSALKTALRMAVEAKGD